MLWFIKWKDDFKGRVEGPEGGAMGSEGGAGSQRGLFPSVFWIGF